MTILRFQKKLVARKLRVVDPRNHSLATRSLTLEENYLKLECCSTRALENNCIINFGTSITI